MTAPLPSPEELARKIEPWSKFAQSVVVDIIRERDRLILEWIEGEQGRRIGQHRGLYLRGVYAALAAVRDAIKGESNGTKG